jgi:PAS domain S-box-containing protein
MKPTYPLDLQARLVVMLVLAFSILFLIPVWHFLEERDLQMKAAKAELLARVKLIAAHQAYLVRRSETILASLAEQPELGPHAEVPSCQQYLVARLSQEPEFVQMSKVLPDGDLVCAGVQPDKAINIADRPYFQRTLQSHTMVTSEVVVGHILKKPLIVFSKAVRSSQDNVTHVVLLALGLDWIAQEIASSELPEGARISVLDGTGDVLMRYPDSEAWSGKNAAHLPAIHQLITGPAEGVFENISFDGKARLFAHTPLLGTAAGSQYHLMLSIPRQVVEAPIRQEALIAFGVMLAVLSASIAAVLWGGHRLLIRPLLRLTRAASRFSAGDHSARSGLPHGKDLLGRLAQTLDHSAAAVAEHERQLHGSEARYRTLVEMSPDAVVVHREGVIVYVNPAAITLFAGRSQADLIGQPVTDFIHPQSRSLAQERFKAMVNQGDSAPLIRQKLLKRDGSVMDVEVQSIAILFNDAPAIQVHIHDQTEHLRRESELSRLQEEMQTMMKWQVARHTAKALAHEINQPLGSLAMLSEAALHMLMASGLAANNNTEQVKQLEAALLQIGQESERAGLVLQNLLQTVQRPETTLELVDVSHLLHATRLEFLMHRGNDYEVLVQCQSELPKVLLNRLQISNVVLNLLNNAAQAMRFADITRGRIVLTADLDANGRQVHLGVRDEGPGIAPSERHKLFHAVVTNKPNGLGMGLAICRTLVELHGGTIWYESQNMAGAQFYFSLPVPDLTA